MEEPRFKKGDKVTFKDRNLLTKGNYRFGGCNQAGFVGTVLEIRDYIAEHNCYKIIVSTGCGSRYGMLESEFEEYDKKEIIKKDTVVKAVKTQVIKVVNPNNHQIVIEREVTVITLVTKCGEVRAGYSVRMPEDKPNPTLAEKIATGRAMNDKTNMVDMCCGIGMDKKYILYAIAEHLIRQVERGSLTIKGIH